MNGVVDSAWRVAYPVFDHNPTFVRIHNASTSLVVAYAKRNHVAGHYARVRVLSPVDRSYLFTDRILIPFYPPTVLELYPPTVPISGGIINVLGHSFGNGGKIIIRQRASAVTAATLSDGAMAVFASASSPAGPQFVDSECLLLAWDHNIVRCLAPPGADRAAVVIVDIGIRQGAAFTFSYENAETCVYSYRYDDQYVDVELPSFFERYWLGVWCGVAVGLGAWIAGVLLLLKVANRDPRVLYVAGAPKPAPRRAAKKQADALMTLTLMPATEPVLPIKVVAASQAVSGSKSAAGSATKRGGATVEPIAEFDKFLDAQGLAKAPAVAVGVADDAAGSDSDTESDGGPQETTSPATTTAAATTPAAAGKWWQRGPFKRRAAAAAAAAAASASAAAAGESRQERHERQEEENKQYLDAMSPLSATAGDRSALQSRDGPRSEDERPVTADEAKALRATRGELAHPLDVESEEEDEDEESDIASSDSGTGMEEEREARQARKAARLAAKPAPDVVPPVLRRGVFGAGRAPMAVPPMLRGVWNNFSSDDSDSDHRNSDREV
jgi:hypothetical protein